MRKIIFVLTIAALAACGRPQGSSSLAINGVAIDSGAETKAPVDSPEASPTPADSPTPTPSPTPTIKAFWQDFHTGGQVIDHPEWTQAAIDALQKDGADLLTSKPRDILSFCPNYMNLDSEGRLDFWVKLISSISLPESSFQPTQHMTENIPALLVFHWQRKAVPRIVSRGLMQVSLQDATGRYQCPFQSEDDVNDPALNIQCGVKILNFLVGRDNVLSGKVTQKKPRKVEWQGAADYWSTMRPTSKAFADVRKRTATSEVCQLAGSSKKSGN